MPIPRADIVYGVSRLCVNICPIPHADIVCTVELIVFKRCIGQYLLPFLIINGDTYTIKLTHSIIDR